MITVYGIFNDCNSDNIKAYSRCLFICIGFSDSTDGEQNEMEQFKEKKKIPEHRD